MARGSHGGDGRSDHQRAKIVETLELSEPIHAFGREITELGFRRPRVHDLFAIDEEEGQVAQTVALVARITDTSAEAIGELGLEDFERVTEVMERFFGRFATTQGRRASRSRSRGKVRGSNRSGRPSPG